VDVFKDYYQSQKNAVPKLTFDFFAQKAGFSSPSFQKLVMDGQKKHDDGEYLKKFQGRYD